MLLGILKAGLRSSTEEDRGGLKVPRGRSFGCPARISRPLLMMGVVLAASLLLELGQFGCFGDTDFVPLWRSEAWLSLGDLRRQLVNISLPVSSAVSFFTSYLCEGKQICCCQSH